MRKRTLSMIAPIVVLASCGSDQSSQGLQELEREKSVLQAERGQLNDERASLQVELQKLAVEKARISLEKERLGLSEEKLAQKLQKADQVQSSLKTDYQKQQQALKLAEQKLAQAAAAQKNATLAQLQSEKQKSQSLQREAIAREATKKAKVLEQQAGDALKSQKKIIEDFNALAAEYNSLRDSHVLLQQNYLAMEQAEQERAHHALARRRKNEQIALNFSNLNQAHQGLLHSHKNLEKSKHAQEREIIELKKQLSEKSRAPQVSQKIQAEILNYQKTIATQKHTIAQLHKSINENRSKPRAQEATATQTRELNRLQASLNGQQTKVKELTSQVQTQNQNHQRKVATLSKELKAANSEVASLNEKNAIMAKMVSRLRAQLAAAQGKEGKPPVKSLVKPPAKAK